MSTIDSATDQSSDVMARKLRTLTQVRGLPAGAVERFEALLAQLDDWSLYRLSPLQIAAQHDFDPKLLLDLLLHATRIGLFDMHWTVVCPGCGSIEYSFASINGLKSGTIHCPTCSRDVAFSLDEQVEVSFSLNPGIRDLSAAVDPFASFENYTRYYFTNSLKRSPQLLEYIRTHIRGFFVVEPDERVNLPLQTEPGKLYRAINLQSHSQFWLRCSDRLSPDPVLIETDLGERGFAESERAAPAGETVIRIHNCSSERRILTLWHADFEAMFQVVRAYPSTREAFLTAKQLLNCQTFREIHRIERLDPDLSLNIGSQTLLFSDLKGSTAMYEQTGDYRAYSLVQRHFDLLTDCVRARGGSVVKTIGDAIMASFSTPYDGLAAAMAMNERLNEIDCDEIELGLKIGLHTGPVLAVNANERLDFFGQTVNIAARVQGLAEAGEIWISEAIHQAIAQSGGLADLEAAGYALERRSAYLKGVSAPTLVWRCSRDI